MDNCAPLQERVDPAGAKIETGTTRRFTERRAARDRNRVEKPRDACKARVAELGEDAATAQNALEDESDPWQARAKVENPQKHD